MPAAVLEQYLAYAEALRPLVTDTSVLVNRVLDEGQRVLFEGAQGSLLDIDHGTYPFVSSSNPGSGGVSAGAGVGPTQDRRRAWRDQGLYDQGGRRSLPDRTPARTRSASCGTDRTAAAANTAPRPAGRAAAGGSTR